MARVTDFEPTIEEFLGQVGNKRIQRYGKTKSKLPKDLPKVKVTEPYIQPEPYSSDMGISRERFPVTQPEFKGYSPEMESALNRYGTPNRPLEELASREAGLSIPEKVPYTQPRAGLVNWESPSISGVSANSINPSEIQKSFNQFQTSQLPQGKGITAINPNTFGTGIVDTLKGYGSSLGNTPVGQFIKNEVGILGETMNSPIGKQAGKVFKGLGSSAGLTTSLASEFASPIFDEGIRRARQQGGLSTIETTPEQLSSDFALNQLQQINNQSPETINSFNSQPTQASATATLPVNQAKGSYTPKDRKPDAINQYLYPGMQQSPNTQNMSSAQQSKNILGEPTQKTFGGVLVTKYINGNPVFSNTTNPYEGMFTGMSKERDAALDSYGKVDKNSEFYKRNKQAMSSLGGGYAEEQNMLNAQRSKDNQDAMDLARFRY